jgi:hypothetical protein
MRLRDERIEHDVFPGSFDDGHAAARCGHEYFFPTFDGLALHDISKIEGSVLLRQLGCFQQ